MKKNLISLCILLSIALCDWEAVSFPEPFANGVVSDNNSIYVIGPDGTVNRSSNDGITWDVIIMGHEDIQPYGLDVSHKVGNYIIISQNITPPYYNFRAYASGSGEVNWEYLPYQDSAINDILSHGPVIYATSWINEGLMVSADVGSTWELFDLPSEEYFKLLYADDQFIYVSDGCDLYRASIESYSWEYITGQLDEIGPEPPYSCTMVSDLSKFRDGIVASVYWYGGVGTLFFSNDNGDSWIEITTFPQEHSAGFYQSVSNLHYKHGLLYAGTATSSSGVFYSDDLLHWVEYSAGLESYNLSVQKIYSTDTSIYKTGGTTNHFRNSLIHIPETGDINGDGILNILDIIQILGLVLDGGYSLVADMNSDSIINVLDIIQLVNIIVS